MRKIRTARVFPTIIGQIIFTSIFGILFAGVFVAWISSVELDSSVESYRYAEQAYNAFCESYEPDGDNSKLFSTIASAIPQINGIAVEEDGKQYGKEVPASFTDMMEVNMPSGFITEDSPLRSIRVNMKESIDADIEADGVSDFLFNENMLSKAILSAVGLIGKDSFENVVNRDFNVFDMWFGFENEGKNILINSSVVVGFKYYFYFIIYALVFGLFFLLLKIYQICSIIAVVSERKHFYDALYTDPVTGSRNWDYFKKQAEKVIKRSVRKKNKLAMIHLRTEKYRSFCTCFGVNEGDELVEQLFEEIKRNLGKKEYVARYERADFALLLNYTEPSALEERLEKLMQKLESVRSDRKLYFDAGICDVENADDLPETLYSNACTARDTIDDSTECAIAWFCEEHQKQRLWEHTVENEAQRALDAHEFTLYLQPKYASQNEQLSAAEALVRWERGTNGIVPPGRFIPIFETNGFITKLDDYMLREVSSVIAKWISQGKEPVPVSVNVSRANFTRTDLAEHILSIVDEYGVPHEYIELELTESAFFDDKKALINAVAGLRKYGFHVSMDDFGTGFSSLNSLKEIPLDTVKLDADFFRGGDDMRGMLIVEKTIGMAKELGMSIVAEGVETREQVDFLASHNCDLIQGYYFAKPMPVCEFEKKAFASEK